MGCAGTLYAGNPLYPFGYGLTYTTFVYSDLQIEGGGLSACEVEEGAQVCMSFTVTNNGGCLGEETAQVYLHDMVSSTVNLEKELAGFAKIALQLGDFHVMVGDNAANVLLTGRFTIC